MLAAAHAPLGSSYWLRKELWTMLQQLTLPARPHAADAVNDGNIDQAAQLIAKVRMSWSRRNCCTHFVLLVHPAIIGTHAQGWQQAHPSVSWQGWLSA